MTPGTFKIEDGILWIYEPSGEDPWRRIGKLEELVPKEVFGITFEQAQQFAKWLMYNRAGDVLCMLFPKVAHAREDGGAEDPELHRELGLALRAIGDKLLLEVS